ncbi:MAG: hypothetical protein KBD56_02095 [Candidatus Eisenbacteria bacterium]|nr:hypothetical protein [Candidatus Eisenbacteria bacterium]
MKSDRARVRDTQVLEKPAGMPPRGMDERTTARLELERRAAVRRIRSLVREVEFDRQKLLAERKDHQAIERLLERRYLEFLCEVLRDEGEPAAGGGVQERELIARAA